jgi:mono/diheme cytochrome c family protein
MSRANLLLTATLVGASVPFAASPPAAGQEAEATSQGEQIYVQWCAGCHGEDGRGEGPGAVTMLPRPRDFTTAQYQIRSTASGELPTDEDILHVIDLGMPGTAMPGWEEVLTNQERAALVEYLKSLSRFFGQGPAPEPLDFGGAPGADEERLAEGAEVYQTLECWRCHGQAGRGDGESSPTLEENTGFPIRAADLTENWRFNGGGDVEDIYRRFNTGLDGTPMPTFVDAVDAGIVTQDQLWSLAHYVRSLSPERTPEVREVIGAEPVPEGELPDSPDGERWAEVERYWIPLVGQIVLGPRWFAPRVSGVWVQALHDGRELALLVSWTDPSESPDSAWTPFATRMREVMGPDTAGGSWTPESPDRLVVQFPQQIPQGMERPYFLQGDGRRPTYLWTWESTSGAREQIGRGLGSAADQESASQTLHAAAVHREGQWQVLFRRSLATPDSAGDLQIPTASAVPIAFQAWDGDNGEDGTQGAVSTWYFINLQQATPVTVYVTPAIALLLTGVFGMVAVTRAQRRERHLGGDASPGSHAVEGAPREDT